MTYTDQLVLERAFRVSLHWQDHVMQTHACDDRAPRLYMQVADDIARMIAIGALAGGERLPSVRSLSKAKRVSIPTVLEAYRTLEDRDLIETRNRSGHYVKYRKHRLDPPSVVQVSGKPAVVDVLSRSRSILGIASRPGLLPFGAAVPSAELFPVRKLREFMSTTLRRRSYLLGEYAFAPGLPALRHEVARRAIRWGCTLDPDNIIVTNGCVEAVSLALRAVTNPGDIVAIESPAYYGFLQLLEILNLKALEVPSDATTGISLDHLARSISRHRVRACLLSTTVTNPTGATMPDASKKELVAILKSRSVPLIEDATFADLQFDNRLLAARSFDRDGGVLLCASLTKTVAPGLRIGWIDAGRYAERISFLKRVTSIGQPEIIQQTLADYLSSGGFERHLRQLQRSLRTQVQQHLAAVADGLPRDTRAASPSGGFLLWLQLPDGVDSLELHTRALSFGIGLAPGTMFSATGNFRNYLRINCGQVWSSEIERGYGHLANLISDLAGGGRLRRLPSRSR